MPVDKLAERHLKGVCKAHEVDDRWIPLTALDTTHIIPMEPRQFGQLLLGQTATCAKTPYAVTERGTNVVGLHGDTLLCSPL
ncbi:MAG: hypothetical protein QOD92_1971 [Acidimicrobiaceae bacterium]|jgi:hypothetical protein